jgi:hypothetical protein
MNTKPTMIADLDEDQKVLVEQNRTAWLDKFFNHDVRVDFDESRARTAIEKLYIMAGLTKPEVVFVDSPTAVQDECNRRCGTVNQIYEFSFHGSVGDSCWVAMYDTFIKLGVKIEPSLLEQFQVMIDIIESGCFMSVQLESLCIVSKMPAMINRDSETRLHSTTGPAISFLDGTAQYYVAGRNIEPEIFLDCADITNAKIRFRSTDNEDIKAVICFIVRDLYGEQGLLDMLEAIIYKEQTVKHSDTYTETLKLYRTKESYSFLMDSKGITNQPYCWLQYTCPSTGAVYLIDTFADFETPLEAAKWHRPAPVPFETPYEWTFFAN